MGQFPLLLRPALPFTLSCSAMTSGCQYPGSHLPGPVGMAVLFRAVGSGGAECETHTLTAHMIGEGKSTLRSVLLLS